MKPKKSFTLKMLAALLLSAAIDDALTQPSAPMNAGALYAIQLAQMTSQASAESVAHQVTAQGYSTSVVATLDSSKVPRWIVTAGKYSTLEEAHAGRVKIQNEMGIAGPLPVIRLPIRDSDTNHK